MYKNLLKIHKNKALLLVLGTASVLGGVSIYSLQNAKKDDSIHPLKEEKTASMAMTEIITLDSGLQYRILNHGNGQTTPTPGSVVTVHYTGWLDEGGKPGKEFDSSKNRGPFSFVVGVGHVIKGWDEGVLQMRTGEKRLLIIPPQLGYGAGGYPGVIPPQATLIFEVELISFK